MTTGRRTDVDGLPGGRGRTSKDGHVHLVDVHRKTVGGSYALAAALVIARSESK
jgi:hypothetical protein